MILYQTSNNKSFVYDDDKSTSSSSSYTNIIGQQSSSLNGSLLFVVDTGLPLFDENNARQLFCAQSDQVMQSFANFVECLAYYVRAHVIMSTLIISFLILTTILNVVVIIHINKLKQYKTVFDRIVCDVFKLICLNFKNLNF